MNARVRLLIVSLLLLIAAAQPIHAQTTEPTSSSAGSTTLAVGIGHNLTWYPETARHAVGFAGNVRFPISRRLSLEPHLGFGYWRGTFGSEARTRQAWSAGANVILSKQRGLLRPYGGGGGGVFMERRSAEITVASGPFAGVHRQVRTSGPAFTAGALAGLDVAIGQSMTIFGEYRLSVLAVSGGALESWSLAGLRVALR